MPFTIAFSGHRPYLPLPPHLATHTELIKSISITMRSHSIPRPDLALIGMAIGFDHAAAEWCLAHSVPYVACIPFPQQPARWNAEQILQWKKLCDAASERIILAPTYSKSALQERNKYMVDRAELLFTFFSGQKGGTYNCIQYARAAPHKPRIVNMFYEHKLRLEKGLL
jgi:uncharacterized phage-like protein YoqJ